MMLLYKQNVVLFNFHSFFLWNKSSIYWLIFWHSKIMVRRTCNFMMVIPPYDNIIMSIKNWCFGVLLIVLFCCQFKNASLFNVLSLQSDVPRCKTHTILLSIIVCDWKEMHAPTQQNQSLANWNRSVLTR